MPAPTKPDAVPRSLGAKRSATTVVSAACIELSAITAPTQKRVIAHRLVICGTANRQRPPTSDPVTIHGVRRPQRVRVRSDRAPAIGVVSVLQIEVIANTTASPLALLEGSSAWLRDRKSTRLNYGPSCAA